MNIHFTTFGCKVNMYESECLRCLFEEQGYVCTDDRDNADVFVVNSCTVTRDSDVKLFKALRRIRREHPEGIIVLMGCYPQAHGVTEEITADIITGTKDRKKIIEMVDRFIADRSPAVSIPPLERNDPFENIYAPSIHGHTRAFMKITDGCAMNCTYCIIPRSRGAVRCKSIGDIRREAKIFAANGYKEIVLIGINLMCYRDGGKRLTDAVEACVTDGIERIRLSSIEPEMMRRDDLLRMRDTGIFCPSFHLALQSGCDKVLREMGRHYTTDEYRKIVDLCREVFPGCGISADIMVGFPGETDEDHRQSARFIRDIGFSDMHVFMYSPRESTPAAARTDQIPPEIKKLRADQISSIGRESSRLFLENHIGKVFPVLTERPGRDGIAHGHAPDNSHVKIFTENILPNSILYVRIDNVGDNFCSGHCI
ncbi:MAG: MiaB/RimO family radical SAM methylthiotransferase [Oscillospiraceae bacterium]|nr:MiaB/RimO family radical SAM methylthiotransferase [Oscillospiraceae bacterium]